jgi:opine dehydrogenase
MRIAIVGAGNGGQAMAGHFSLLGHDVKLYNRRLDHLGDVIRKHRIRLSGVISGEGSIALVSDSLEKVLCDVELVMVTTTADAHRTLAEQMAPYLYAGQKVVLNPGRTFGALEFAKVLCGMGVHGVLVAEAQSLIYACRLEAPGYVRIIAVKDRVLLAAYPARDTEQVLAKLNTILPCFIKAEHVLETSLENIGAILHPPVMLLNAAAIERGNLFYFYQDMTSAVADLIQAVDAERLAVGAAFGVKLLSVGDWISYAYKGSTGSTFLEKIHRNSAYHMIKAPNTLYSRLLLEDVPTGVIPIAELGKLSGVDTPLLLSISQITQTLLNVDFSRNGRTLRKLGLEGKSVKELLKEL